MILLVRLQTRGSGTEVGDGGGGQGGGGGGGWGSNAEAEMVCGVSFIILYYTKLVKSGKSLGSR